MAGTCPVGHGLQGGCCAVPRVLWFSDFFLLSSSLLSLFSPPLGSPTFPWG